MSTKPRPPRRAPGTPGFTLIETSLALVIIGVGVLAFVDANTSFIRDNAWSSHAATATFLGNEIRELTRTLPRHDPVTGLYLEGQGAGAVLQGWGPDTGEIVVADLDDLDDFDGLTFGVGGDLDGPINGFGEVVPQTDPEGNVVMQNGVPEPLRGWTQTVFVEKVDPFNPATVRADSYVDPPAGSFAGRGVDAFPLRVTVIVNYQGENDPTPAEVSRVAWIVP